MRFLLPHRLDVAALRGELAIGTVTREESLAALSHILDVAIPAIEAEHSEALVNADDLRRSAEAETVRLMRRVEALEDHWAQTIKSKPGVTP